MAVKATLSFNLDLVEDRIAHLRCTKALEMAIALQNVLDRIRTWTKYDVVPEFDSMVQELREIITADLNIDELLE